MAVQRLKCTSVDSINMAALCALEALAIACSLGKELANCRH
jgi:hypothetical protein